MIHFVFLYFINAYGSHLYEAESITRFVFVGKEEK